MRKSFAFSLLSFRKHLGSNLACIALLALLLAITTDTARADERAVKSRVQPIYPELAKRMKIAGLVSVQATVDAGGKVTDAKATNGNRLLGGAAEDAVRKWKFVPGEGVSVVTVEINFTMQ
jgi:TonB family protein